MFTQLEVLLENKLDDIRERGKEAGCDVLKSPFHKMMLSSTESQALMVRYRNGLLQHELEAGVDVLPTTAKRYVGEITREAEKCIKVITSANDVKQRYLENQKRIEAEKDAKAAEAAEAAKASQAADVDDADDAGDAADDADDPESMEIHDVDKPVEFEVDMQEAEEDMSGSVSAPRLDVLQAGAEFVASGGDLQEEPDASGAEDDKPWLDCLKWSAKIVKKCDAIVDTNYSWRLPDETPLDIRKNFNPPLKVITLFLIMYLVTCVNDVHLWVPYHSLYLLFCVRVTTSLSSSWSCLLNISKTGP